MTLGSICGASGEWGRGLFKCPFCRARRRGLLALVFGGVWGQCVYGANAICGGCGSRFSDGEGRFERNVTRADEAIAFVRQRWKTARPWRMVTREAYEHERSLGR